MSKHTVSGCGLKNCIAFHVTKTDSALYLHIQTVVLGRLLSYTIGLNIACVSRYPKGLESEADPFTFL